MFIPHLLTAWTLTLIVISPFTDGRFLTKRTPSENKPSCNINSECLQKRLPLLPPSTRQSRDQARDKSRTRRDFVKLDTNCGVVYNTHLDLQKFRVTLSGASGGGGNQYGAAGGRGAVITANLSINSRDFRGTHFSYYLGCPGIQNPSQWVQEVVVVPSSGSTVPVSLCLICML